MAFNRGDSITLSGVMVVPKDSSKKEYISFTVPTGRGREMITYRVFYKSGYVPKSGKHANKKCVPVSVTKWEQQERQNFFN